MSGQDPRLPICQSTVGKDFVGDTASLQLDGLRLAYSHDVAGIGVDKVIEECCRNSALGLIDGGATVDPMDVDLSEGRKAFLHLRGLWFVSHMHDHLDRLSEMGENVRGNVEAGLKLTTEQLAWANAARGRMWSFFEEFFRRCVPDGVWNVYSRGTGINGGFQKPVDILGITTSCVHGGKFDILTITSGPSYVFAGQCHDLFSILTELVEHMNLRGG